MCEAYQATDQYHDRQMNEAEAWREYREAVIDHLNEAIKAFNKPELSKAESARAAFYHIEEAHSVIVNGDYDFK